jgi:hypothetical protein
MTEVVLITNDVLSLASAAGRSDLIINAEAGTAFSRNGNAVLSALLPTPRAEGLSKKDAMDVAPRLSKGIPKLTQIDSRSCAHALAAMKREAIDLAILCHTENEQGQKEYSLLALPTGTKLAVATEVSSESYASLISSIIPPRGEEEVVVSVPFKELIQAMRVFTQQGMNVSSVILRFWDRGESFSIETGPHPRPRNVYVKPSLSSIEKVTKRKKAAMTTVE